MRVFSILLLLITFSGSLAAMELDCSVTQNTDLVWNGKVSVENGERTFIVSQQQFKFFVKNLGQSGLELEVYDRQTPSRQYLQGNGAQLKWTLWSRSILIELNCRQQSHSKEFTLERITTATDRNFNGIVRGLGVFQVILTEDYGAYNERGLLSIKGQFTLEQVIVKLFEQQRVVAEWTSLRNHTLLDRGYLYGDGGNPRVPVKLQKVIDLYNSQIMGLVSSSVNYRLGLFKSGEEVLGWIILNSARGEALYASSSFQPLLF